MSALIFLVIGTSEGNLFSFLSQLAYNSGILSKFATSKVGKKNVLIIYAPRWLLSGAKQPLLRK